MSEAVTECRVCGFTLDYAPKEAEGELLVRCPSCGAYDWQPPPIFVPADRETERS